MVARDLLLPNGQTLAPGGSTLLVAESAGQRLTAFTVTADGSLRDRRVWASLGEPATATTLPEVVKQVRVWPDGIALDADATAWVANPFGKEIIRIREGGEITERISTGDLACYAAALGGPDGRTLYLCAAPPSLDETTRHTQRSARLLTCHVDTPAVTSTR